MLVKSVPTSKKGLAARAGKIHKEFGLCTALETLALDSNKLDGEHFFAHIDQLVYECFEARQSSS